MFNEIITNKVLIIPICAWAVSQLLKAILLLIQKKPINLQYLVISGGMPSSHSTFVTALATAVAYIEGIASAAFGISVIFALVIMYDAAGIRQSVGNQAVVLNRIIRELGDRHHRTELGHDLREFVGHTPFQVIIGGLLGIFIAWLWIAIAGI